MAPGKGLGGQGCLVAQRMTDNFDESRATLERLASGDDQVLAEVFSQHHDRLRRMVHFRMDRRLAGRVDADDVLQDAFLEASQRVPHYLKNPTTTVFVWLRSVVFQTLVDTHRRHVSTQKRDATRDVSIDRNGFQQSTSTGLAIELMDSVTTPSGAAARAETERELEQAIATMNETDQEILALRHFEELTNAEVAEVLGIAVKAASIRYVRALQRLKEILSSVSGIQGSQANG